MTWAGMYKYGHLVKKKNVDLKKNKKFVVLHNASYEVTCVSPTGNSFKNWNAIIMSATD